MTKFTNFHFQEHLHMIYACNKNKSHSMFSPGVDKRFLFSFYNALLMTYFPHLSEYFDITLLTLFSFEKRTFRKLLTYINAILIEVFNVCLELYWYISIFIKNYSNLRPLKDGGIFL